MENESMIRLLIETAAQCGPKVNVKVTKNAKGYTWEATVLGAKNVEEALCMLNEAEAKLDDQYGARE